MLYSTPVRFDQIVDSYHFAHGAGWDVLNYLEELLGSRGGLATAEDLDFYEVSTKCMRPVWARLLTAFQTNARMHSRQLVQAPLFCQEGQMSLTTLFSGPEFMLPRTLLPQSLRSSALGVHNTG